MNYIRKIDKLNKKIKALEEENGQLKLQIKERDTQIKECDRIKQRCEFQTKLAEQKEQVFQKLIIELEDEKEKYRYLIQQLRTTLNKNKNVYKKAVNDIKKNLTK